MIFLDLKFLVKSDFLGSMKDAGNFWVAKKNRRVFLVAKERTKRFWGVS